jgi:type I restriction enzyme S subunit
MLPKFLSKYGTIDTVKYIGNPKELKTLKKRRFNFWSRRL